MKKLLFFALAPLILTSCQTKPELREDIKKFISKFSLQVALEEYKSGGYISTKVENSEGKETKTRNDITQHCLISMFKANKVLKEFE